uniref:Lipopolysaccharide-induced tumor necrosis factor-alpha factor n=1 Tax=Ascaris suum TaxID=6253 RepID=F1LED3_ASCSU
MNEPPPAYEAISSPYAPNNCGLKEGEYNERGHYPLNQPQLDVPPCNPTVMSVPVAPARPPTTIYVSSLVFGAHAVNLCCPHCQAQILTQTVGRAGLLTWLICGGLALVGCWLCCPIPFCVASCQDVEHYCPKCRRLLGTYRRL